MIQRSLAAPLGGASAIVAIGRAEREDYQRRFPRQLVHDIPYACALEPFEAAAKRRQPGPVRRFLFAGQMIERKGVDLLLRAFERVVTDGADAKLHLIGREGNLPGWLERLGPTIRDRVRYHGFQQPGALTDFFERAEVFVLPSRHDGWGVVVNQALGAGRDLVEDGREGLHVPPGEIEPLAQAMHRLAQDPGLRERMGKAASIKARTITPAAAAEKWVEVLESG